MMAPLRHLLGVAVGGAVFALLAGCTFSSTSANPATSNLVTQSSVVTGLGTSPSASTSSAAPSSASTSLAPATPPSISPSAATPSSPKPTKTSTSTKSTAPPTGPWPANLTAAQVKEAQAALAAYKGYWQLLDTALTSPAGGAATSKNWTAQVNKFATGTEAAGTLQYFKELHAAGQYSSGKTGINPKVTKVQPALVTLTDCVDHTATGLFNRAGKSIKAANVSGSYFRHVSEVQIAQYVGGKWLVTVTADNWDRKC
jgi:hypothetical protein